MHRPTYQETLKYNLTLAGPEPTFFAQYQSDVIAQWFAHLRAQPITIVDVGCGDGLLTSFIAAQFHNANVHGVDPSLEHIDVARLAYPYLSFDVYSDTLPVSALGNNVEVLSSYVGLTPFPDACTDLVIMADTLHHIPAHMQAAKIAEIMRIVKPGGICCILEQNPYNPCMRYRFACNRTTMIRPQKLRSLVSHYGTTRMVFYHFFSALRAYERYVAWLPLGQLYACITIKK
ncbi:MAG: class I SAM-dependent methyltransferase [Candidatus Babeliales bacterium]